MLRYKLILGAVMTLTINASAFAVELTGASNCEFSRLVGRAIGLGPQELAVMAIGSEAHALIVGDVESYCTGHRETLESLLSNVLIKKNDAARSYELTAVDIPTKDSAHVTAVNALVEGCSDLIGTINGRLTSEQRTLWAQRLAHPLFGVEVAILNLSGEQVTSILAAQRTRDEVLRHQSERKDLNQCAESMSIFETALTAILDGNQETALAAARIALTDNLTAIDEYEETHCGA